MNNQEPDSTEDARVPEVPRTDAEPLFPEPEADMPDAVPLDTLNGNIEDAVPAQGPASVHREVRVRTSVRAVTGVVDSCTRVSPAP